MKGQLVLLAIGLNFWFCFGSGVQQPSSDRYLAHHCHRNGEYFTEKPCTPVFYECVQQVDGSLRPVRKSCGPGTVFDMHNLDCDYPQNTPSCKSTTIHPPKTTHRTTPRTTIRTTTTRKSTTTTTMTSTTTTKPSTTTSPITTPHTPAPANKVCKHEGLNPDTTENCNRHFYDCYLKESDETWVAEDMYCPKGTFFDPDSERCLYDSQCPSTTTSSTSTTIHPTQPTTGPSTTTIHPTQPTTGPSTSSQRPSTTIHPAQCQREGQYLPDPNVPRDCQVYYSCHRSTGGGQWTQTKCKCMNGLMFDPDLEVCTWPSGDCANFYSLAKLAVNRRPFNKMANVVVSTDVCNA